MKMKKKRSASKRTVVFLIAVAITVASAVAMAFSLPETWGDFDGFVSKMTEPLPDAQVGLVGAGLLVAAVLLLAAGVVVAYREIRRQDATVGAPSTDADFQQEAAADLLREQGYVVKNPNDKPPRRSVIVVALLMMATAISMLLWAPVQIETKHPPRVALGENEAVAKAPAEKRRKPGGSATDRRAEDPGSSSDFSGPGPEEGLPPEAGKSSGGPCVCPPVSPSGGGGGGSEIESGSESEFEEVEVEEPEEEPEFEEIEDFESEEAEFEEIEFE